MLKGKTDPVMVYSVVAATRQFLDMSTFVLTHFNPSLLLANWVMISLLKELCNFNKADVAEYMHCQVQDIESLFDATRLPKGLSEGSSLTLNQVRKIAQERRLFHIELTSEREACEKLFKLAADQFKLDHEAVLISGLGCEENSGVVTMFFVLAKDILPFSTIVKIADRFRVSLSEFDKIVDTGRSLIDSSEALSLFRINVANLLSE